MAKVADRSAICICKSFFVAQRSALCLLMMFLPGCFSPPHGVCGGLFSGSGTIATPNFPFTYPSNICCVWNLVAKNGNVIVIQFVTVEIDLTGDLLMIYNGSTSVMNLTGSKPPFNLTLGTHVSLKFTSDDSVGNMGFQLHWATGISCQPGYEYFDGHTCRLCTGAGSYLSRKVRNCSQDSDAEYTEEYSSQVQRGAVNESLPSSTVIPKEDSTEKTVLWNWLGPLIVGGGVLIAVVTWVCRTRCKKSNKRSLSSPPPYSPVPAQVAI